MLQFSPANAKLQQLNSVESLRKFLTDKRKVYSLDLLSGWTCPFAKECLSKVKVDKNGKKRVVDGPDTKFRCFSASQEVFFPSVYNRRKYNTDLLKARKNSMEDMRDLIMESMPENMGICRIHAAGDFFNPLYFDAWVWVAYHNPDRLFYAYTKSIPYVVNWDRRTLPKNFVVTGSRGGRADHLITRHKLREAIVVFDEQTAWDADLEIDHDDSHASDPSKKNQSFALLIHGIQPKGSEAGKALSALGGKGGKSSYNKKVGSKYV